MQKRGFFQIHLSTAIVLTLVASGMLWLNLQCSVRGCGAGAQFSQTSHGYGLPVPWYFSEAKYWYSPAEPYEVVHHEDGWSIKPLGLLIDVVAAVAILLAVGWVMEKGLRWHDAAAEMKVQNRRN